MRWLKQTIAVMLLNLRTIPARLGSSAVAIIGIAGVVVIFVSLLSISAGFSAAVSGSGSPNRALVLRTGSESELTSGIDGAETRVIREAPGVSHDGETALISAELLVILDLPKKSTPDSPANVPMRGIEPVGMKVRDEVSLTEGRMFRFGTNEVIVGRGANNQFVGLNIGDTVVSGQNKWVVTGIFQAKGGASESEIWADVQNLQSVYRRVNAFQSVLAKVDSAEEFRKFSDWVMKNPQVHVDVHREDEFYKSQSTTMTQLINTLGFGIASLMGIGAVFGAILTMYTAVASRTREIATLRALGFSTTSILVSVLAESLVLGGVGGLIGAVISYVAFDGFQTSTMNFQTFSQVAFAFRVTPQLFAMGIVYALTMGLIGGLFPAIRAARLPIPVALREL